MKTISGSRCLVIFSIIYFQSSIDVANALADEAHFSNRHFSKFFITSRHKKKITLFIFLSTNFQLPRFFSLFSFHGTDDLLLREMVEMTQSNDNFNEIRVKRNAKSEHQADADNQKCPAKQNKRYVRCYYDCIEKLFLFCIFVVRRVAELSFFFYLKCPSRIYAQFKSLNF